MMKKKEGGEIYQNVKLPRRIKVLMLSFRTSALTRLPHFGLTFENAHWQTAIKQRSTATRQMTIDSSVNGNGRKQVDLVQAVFSVSIFSANLNDMLTI